MIDLQNSLSGWKIFYRQVFYIALDFSGLYIPKSKPGFDFLLVIAEGMTPEVLGTCKAVLPLLRYCHEESVYKTIQSSRTSEKGNYAVWASSSTEPDGRHIGEMKTAPLESEITFEEEMLRNFYLFWEKGKPLFSNNWTLCAGSNVPKRESPILGWHTDLKVFNWHVGNALMISLDGLPCVCEGHQQTRYVVH